MVRGFKVYVAGTALAAVWVMGAGVAHAQDPPAAQPQAAEPQKPALTFEGDAAYLMVFVKPDKVADFEMILNRTKEAMAKSEKPERKQQAASWRVFKLPQQAQGSEVYYFFFDPPVAGQEYDPIRLIYEVFPTEATELFTKFKDSRNPGGGGSGLKFVMKMSQ
jgi:hypothetical protein